MNIQEANQTVQEWINEGDEEAALDLNGLTSAVGLTLPTSVEYLSLKGLPESDKEALRQRHPNLADKIK